MKKISSGAREAASAAICLVFMAQTAYAARPDYYGGVTGDAAASHDGKLRWAVGVQNVQVVRSAPDNPSQTDGTTTLYRHHQFIAYWGGRFWVMHDGDRSSLAWSTNGLDWSPSESSEIFADKSVHRMAFYVASNGRFLASHWIGLGTGNPGTRLVREIFGPNSYGTIYSIKANYTGAYPNKTWPDWTTSGDIGFKAACDELRNNRLSREQWQEEDYKDPSFYTIGGGTKQWKAFSWYRLPDDRIVGTWKGVNVAVSTGSDWSPGNVPQPEAMASFGYNPSAKVWGARTEDGLFAMVGCTPGGDLSRRWPLALTTSSEGLTFSTPYLVIAGDLPPQRYENAGGDDKNSGPQYVRGFSPGNGDPPGSDLWLTYSMNKEDIWVARVPVPVTGKVTSDVYEDFQGQVTGRRVDGWNTYCPQWATVTIAADGANQVLRLEDRDPVDYASAMRVFPETDGARIAFQVRPHQAGANSAPLEIDVLGYKGDRAVAIALDPATSQITAVDGATLRSVASYSASAWVRIEIKVFAPARQYNLIIDGSQVLSGADFLESSPTVERVVFRTGAFRLRDFTRRPTTDPWLASRIPGADAIQTASTFDIDAVALERDAGLIRSIDFVSTGRVYQKGVAVVGAKPYIDRSYAITSLPAALVGMEMIQTSNEDDYVSTANHLRFTLSKNAVVYLAFNFGAGIVLPDWAAGFSDTGLNVQVQTANTFRVYRKSFLPGQVALGGNDRNKTNAPSNYFVLAAPEPDNPGDGGETNEEGLADDGRTDEAIDEAIDDDSPDAGTDAFVPESEGEEEAVPADGAIADSDIDVEAEVFVPEDEGEKEPEQPEVANLDDGAEVPKDEGVHAADAEGKTNAGSPADKGCSCGGAGASAGETFFFIIPLVWFWMRHRNAGRVQGQNSRSLASAT